MKKYLRAFIYLVLFSILLGAFVYLGKKDFQKQDITDAERFNQDYPEISVNNKFVYVNSNEVIDLLSNGTGILFIGFPSNEWAQYYVKNFYNVVVKYDVKEIYYYDVLKDRSKNTKRYREIEEILKSHLMKTDEEKEYLFTPALIFIKNGQIVYYDDETSIISSTETPENYWNENNINLFSARMNLYLNGENYNG